MVYYKHFLRLVLFNNPNSSNKFDSFKKERVNKYEIPFKNESLAYIITKPES